MSKDEESMKFHDWLIYINIQRKMKGLINELSNNKKIGSKIYIKRKNQERVNKFHSPKKIVSKPIISE